MCGICGVVSHSGQRINEAVLREMTQALKHRGPDDSGVEIFGSTGLGQTRLSIIDLSPSGHQPMSDMEERYWIVYNGEVYNYVEIRKELAEHGVKFRSHSDTEVVLYAFRQWGLDCVHKFRGMWAFCIWDNFEKKAYLCRDRTGIKPLYWYQHNNTFIFGSELKAFYPHPDFQPVLDKKSVAMYLRHGMVADPYAIYHNTHKLQPGYWLVLDANGRTFLKKYWDIEDYFVKDNFISSKIANSLENEEKILDEFEEILKESFKLCLVADVPVGVFLSGGIDSSLICAVLQKELTYPIKTFTIGFDNPEYDEAPWAKRIAEHIGTDHTEIYCGVDNTWDAILKISEIYDEPFGDSSAIPTYLVSKLARQQVKVSLTGNGGDELFAGYSYYELFERLMKLPANRYVSSAISLLPRNLLANIYGLLSGRQDSFDRYKKLLGFLRRKGFSDRYEYFSSEYDKDDLSALGLEDSYNIIQDPGDDFKILDRLIMVDFRRALPGDYLVKVDRASMAVGLEGREPLLDNKVVEFAGKLPTIYKRRGSVKKYLLKQMLSRYVPRELFERPKRGFAVPMYTWFKDKDNLQDLLKHYLSQQRIQTGGIFNSQMVQSKLNEFLAGKKTSAHKLWLLLQFEMWREHNHIQDVR
jgi:asparagine synthase (glutamine-hydrolysing)